MLLFNKIMKLYTEEQVIQMIEKSRETGLTAEFLILTTTPIKLPSDEGREEKLIKELITISWRRGFMNGLLAGSIICAIISTLIITIVL
jgi:hypothetical protein